MLKIASNDVIDFIGYITSYKTLKKKFSDVWLHIGLIKYLFQEFKQCKDDIHHETFMNKDDLLSCCT